MRILVLALAFSLFQLQTLAQAVKPGQKPAVQSTKPPAKPKPAAASNAGGYNIKLTLTPLKNQWVYLYNYFGKNYQMADSAMLGANSEAVFRGNKKLPGGIYIVVNQNRARLFDVLMDAEQQFSIKVDTSNYDDVTIAGSRENDLYSGYTRFLALKVPQINRLQKQLATAGNKQDSTKIMDQLRVLDKEMNDYRDNIMKNQPNSMLAAFFNTMKKPDFPPVPVVNGKPDSAYPFRYVKEHYWDDVDFADARLLRTPFFDPKLEEYFKYYVSPIPDSIIPEVNYMLLASRDSKDMFTYLLGRFTDKYINPEIMGQDKVFVFLFNNFFLKGDTSWLTPAQRKYIFERGYSLITNQIGEQAPILNLVDTSGKRLPVYGFNAPFTFIFFWDPNCGHCKEMAPRVDSIYQASWKDLGVKIYAVNIDAKANDAWKKYIVSHKLKDWYHVYQLEEEKKAEFEANQPNYRQLYDVTQTPTMYLLDKDKRIMAKKLTIEQFHDLILLKLKQKTSTK